MGSSAETATDLAEARYAEVRKVTLVGSLVDFLLGVAKIGVGYLAHSQALIADGIHSLSDLATDFMVIYAARHAHREADEAHPYGHGRIETAATVLLALALALVAVGIGWDSVRRLFQPELLPQPGFLALLVALISIVSKEVIYHYTLRAARRLRSEMLRANAWHSRTDAISSIVVLIGIGGTMAGLPYLDAIAAVAVAVMIAKIAWDLGASSVRELIDTALDATEVEAIRDTILGIDGVQALHMLRTRKSGADALVDVHLIVDPKVSVSEGHQIGEQVRGTLIEQLDQISDVTVHIDPEDDESNSPCDHLPLREEMERRLRACWTDIEEADRIEHITLHYLDGRVLVDVVLPLEVAHSPAEARALAKRLRAAVQRLDDLGGVKVYYH